MRSERTRVPEMALLRGDYDEIHLALVSQRVCPGDTHLDVVLIEFEDIGQVSLPDTSSELLELRSRVRLAILRKRENHPLKRLKEAESGFRAKEEVEWAHLHVALHALLAHHSQVT